MTRTHRPARRLSAGLAALSVGLSAGVVALTAAPAHAADTGVVAGSGTLAWGFKQSFRSYVGNQTAALPPIGALPYGERITVTEPGQFDLAGTPASSSNQATPNETLPYLLPVSGGHATSQTDVVVDTAGGFEYHFPSHYFDITVKDVSVQVAGGTASIVADVEAVVTGDFGEWKAGTYGGDDITVAVADAATVSLTDNAVTVAATGLKLTAAGAEALPLYQPGEALDNLTVSAAIGEQTFTPSVTVSQTVGLNPADTTTVTVTGSGFDPAANVGTRPPLAGQPSGFYVVFGKFADGWRPSEGAASSARTVISQKWVLPEPSFTAQGGESPYVLLNANGSFTTTLEVSTDDSVEGNYGVYVYAAGGATNPDHELVVPVSFAGGGDIPVEVTVPEITDPGEPGEPTEPGTWEWTIDGGSTAIDLGTADQGDDAFTAAGALHTVTVTDTRAGAPRWEITGQAGDFADGDKLFTGSALGWTPVVTSGDALAGSAVEPGEGTGLAESRTLASAAAGHGADPVVVDATLGLRLPLSTPAGAYVGVLTLTALG